MNLLKTPETRRREAAIQDVHRALGAPERSKVTMRAVLKGVRSYVHGLRANIKEHTPRQLPELTLGQKRIARAFGALGFAGVTYEQLKVGTEQNVSTIIDILGAGDVQAQTNVRRMSNIVPLGKLSSEIGMPKAFVETAKRDYGHSVIIHSVGSEQSQDKKKKPEVETIRFRMSEKGIEAGLGTRYPGDSAPLKNLSPREAEICYIVTADVIGALEQAQAAGGALFVDSEAIRI